MSAAALISKPDPSPADGPRLDVRIGGRTVSYALDRDSFVVGSGLGCDLRIPGQQVPATFCRIDKSSDGLYLQSLSPTLPILVNGQPVTGDTPVTLASGDRLTIGPADAIVRLPAAVPRPKLFVPIDPPPKSEPVYLRPKLVTEERNTGWDSVRPGQFSVDTGPAVPEFETTPNERNLDELHSQLLARTRELDERAAELEADRVLWYRRRQEMERELHAPAEDGTRMREADLAAKELDLARARDELSTLRQSLYDQYRERRDQLAEMQDSLRTQAAALAERDRTVRERESAAERRWQEADRLQAESAAYESRLTALRDNESRLESALLELERQRRAAAELREALARDRETFDAERAHHETTWQERELRHQSREAELVRRESDVQQSTRELDTERAKAVDAVASYNARFADLQNRHHALERRTAEVNARHEQLLRDVAESEEHALLIDAEQRRLQHEQAQLDRAKADLETREAALANRTSACESQHAALAVLRAALDRRQAELTDREAQAAAVQRSLAASQAEIDARLADAERLREELGSIRLDADTERRAVSERSLLLKTELEEIQRQKQSLANEVARLATKESELDDRSADLAEQTAVLKARIQQVFDLQERLEADRKVVREREASLGESESARLGLQDQLRRRAEELSARAKQLDAAAIRHAEERVEIDRLRGELQAERDQFAAAVHARDAEWNLAYAEIERKSTALAEREDALTRQVNRLREVGQTVAAERKDLFAAKQNWERERAASLAEDDERQRRLAAFQQDVSSSLESLTRQAPDLEERSRDVLGQLAAARDVLRQQLEELHAFAGHGRADLDAVHEQIRKDAESLRERERQFELARAEHRHAVAAFRQQMAEWQASLADLRHSIERGETTIDTKRADLDSAARDADERSRELARREEELREARRAVAQQKGELDRHLKDMRDWYKKKLRELAVQNREANGESETPREDDLSPADRHLGELLRTRDLVDADTLQSLWADAIRQRRSLRQVLLSSGAITLYQLALIEAGNLDALMVGRFRVTDRIRSTPREIVLKVNDPERSGEPGRGAVVLRMLGDAERLDAVHPDEYRQRFMALARANHPNLGATLDVLDVAGRPAAVQEWIGGLPSSEWPAVPTGVWLKLLTDAAAGLAALHRAGLTHGRLTAESIQLTSVGLVKVVDGGLPAWLDGQAEPNDDSFAQDLRTLAAIAESWSAKSEARKGKKVKPLPDPLRALLRRLAAGAEFPMADEVAKAEPYPDADHLLVDLHRLAAAYPCPPAEWAKLLDSVAEESGETPSKKAA
jgi:chromosome segregation ATPase